MKKKLMCDADQDIGKQRILYRELYYNKLTGDFDINTRCPLCKSNNFRLVCEGSIDSNSNVFRIASKGHECLDCGYLTTPEEEDMTMSLKSATFKKLEQELVGHEKNLDKWLRKIGSSVLWHQPEAATIIDYAIDELIAFRNNELKTKNDLSPEIKAILFVR